MVPLRNPRSFVMKPGICNAIPTEAFPPGRISRLLGRLVLFASITALLFAALPFSILAQSAEEKYKEASSAYDRGDFGQAIFLYEQALKLQPDSVPIRADLGVALVRLGRYTEAINNYELALKRDPENEAVRLNLALAWYKQAVFAKATEELEILRKSHPKNRQALYLLADCYLRLGKNDEVASLLRPEYEANPRDLAVDYALGTALIRQGKIHEGEVVIDPILKGGDTSEANLLMGEAQFAANDYGAAVATLRKAVNQNPELPEAWSLYGHALLDAGAENLADAKTAFQRALQLDPNDFSANLLLGSIFRREGDYLQAMPYEESALRLRPASPEAHFQVAALHAALGKFEDARKEFEHLEREYPDFLEVHVQLAAIYARMNLPKESQHEREIVLKLNEKARETELRPKP
jgi:tetratricopeptide (TPR) repeat protein